MIFSRCEKLSVRRRHHPVLESDKCHNVIPLVLRIGYPGVHRTTEYAGLWYVYAKRWNVWGTPMPSYFHRDLRWWIRAGSRDEYITDDTRWWGGRKKDIVHITYVWRLDSIVSHSRVRFVQWQIGIAVLNGFTTRLISQRYRRPRTAKALADVIV